MKKTIERSKDRGGGDYGWLKTNYSFSFANYYNPERIGFGTLRVLNDDIIEAGKGFGTHSHDNMEIITIVLDGTLAHKDSTGGEGTIKPGEVQVMSAGSGVKHSEFNASKTKPAKILQIWIDTKENDIEPRYDQKKFDFPKNNLVVIASGLKEGLHINQDAKLSLGEFEVGKKIVYKIKKGNGLFIFVIEGKINAAEESLNKRDSLAIYGTDSLDIKVEEDSRILLIEVPMITDNES